MNFVLFEFALLYNPFYWKSFYSHLQQNQDRKHRTYVYVLTVTETLDAWEDSVTIGERVFVAP